MAAELFPHGMDVDPVKAIKKKNSLKLLPRSVTVTAGMRTTISLEKCGSHGRMDNVTYAMLMRSSVTKT